jgi:hypothetical protein
MTLIGVGLIIGFGLLSHKPDPVKVNSNKVGLINALLGLPYIWFGYRVLKKNIPKGFDIFNEEF